VAVAETVSLSRHVPESNTNGRSERSNPGIFRSPRGPSALFGDDLAQECREGIARLDVYLLDFVPTGEFRQLRGGPELARKHCRRASLRRGDLAKRIVEIRVFRLGQNDGNEELPKLVLGYLAFF
jgi:hypothetical protein